MGKTLGTQSMVASVRVTVSRQSPWAKPGWCVEGEFGATRTVVGD